jgi:hypothetical protein
MALRRGRYMVRNMDGGSNPAGALCELLLSFWVATDTTMPPLIFAPTLEYIQVPRC